MVKWELYRNGQVIQTSTFNSVTNTPPTSPNLANACISTPVSNAAPHIPTSLSGFVGTLYSCVLGTSQPGTQAISYSLGNLASGPASIQRLYAAFFACNSPSLPTNDSSHNLSSS